MRKFLANPSNRRWVYDIASAVGLLAVGFGWLSGEQWALIAGVIVAVLNIGTNTLARFNIRKD